MRALARVLLGCFLVWACLPAAPQAAAQMRGPSSGSQEEEGQVAPEPLISMDFRNAEIGDILRLLARQHDLNIILGEGVQGPISVRFTRVSVDEALDAIITVNGFSYTRRGRVIRVTVPGAAERETLQTEVMSVQHATARELAEPLQSVLSPTGSMQADPRSNALVVRDTPASLQTVKEVLKTLDVPSPQVLIETKIIETVLTDEERLGLNWNLAASVQGSAQPTTFPFTQGTSTVNPLKQFAPVGQTASESTTTTTATGATGTATSTAFPTSAEGILGAFPFVQRDAFTFGTVSFNQFQLLLQALEARGQTKALAVPSITTLDNQEAQIVVGSNVPVPTFVLNRNTGEYEITGYTNLATGVTLRVTPHVTQGERILLEIHPEISNIERFVGDPRAQVPVTNTRKADTRVELKDGETVVIAGLINEKEVESRRSVPLLGKIPFLGRLFRFDEETQSRTDLLIFITAHVLTDDERQKRAVAAAAGVGRPGLFDFSEARRRPEGPPKPFKRRSPEERTGTGTESAGTVKRKEE